MGWGEVVCGRLEPRPRECCLSVCLPGLCGLVGWLGLLLCSTRLLLTPVTLYVGPLHHREGEKQGVGETEKSKREGGR